MTVERRLIEAIRRSSEEGPDIPGMGIGDDAAFLLTSSFEHEKLIISTDSLAEGVHFDPKYGGYHDAAVKLFEMSASDILAKGGTPRWALCNLSVTPNFAESQQAVLFLDTLVERLHQKGVALIGGDVTGAAANVFTMTVLGIAGGAAGNFIFRKNDSIAPGDLLVMAGRAGGSSFALKELQAGRPGERLGGHDEAKQSELLESYLRPQAQWNNSWLHTCNARASIDQSDTLHETFSILAADNNITLEVDLERLELAPPLRKLAAPERYAAALNGAEDFAIVAILPGAIPGANLDANLADNAKGIAEAAHLQVIGSVKRLGAAKVDYLGEEGEISQEELTAMGVAYYRHF